MNVPEAHVFFQFPFHAFQTGQKASVGFLVNFKEALPIRLKQTLIRPPLWSRTKLQFQFPNQKPFAVGA